MDLKAARDAWPFWLGAGLALAGPAALYMAICGVTRGEFAYRTSDASAERTTIALPTNAAGDRLEITFADDLTDRSGDRNVWIDPIVLTPDAP